MIATKGPKDPKGPKGFPALVILSLLILPPLDAASQITAAPMASAPPEAVAAPVAARLGGDGVAVTAEQARLEFWWVKALAIAGGAPVSWESVPEGSLLGVLRLGGPFKDIRGKPIAPGVYTVRLGLQPQNGDHLGASPFREHLLLSPASEDRDPTALGHDRAVEISKLATGTSHPAVLSLDPPMAESAPLSVLRNELDHHGVTLQIPTTGGAPLRFGLILIGLIEP